MLDFTAHPGRAFVAATLLPLLPVVLLLIAGTVRNLTRARRSAGGWKASVYWLLGGDQPLKFGGYLGVAAILGSAALAGWGTVQFFADAGTLSTPQLEARWAERTEWVRIGAAKADRPAVALEVGYRIDRLTALMVSMVTGIGSLIFLFALGYMSGEAKEKVEDHDSHTHRRGRFLVLVGRTLRVAALTGRRLRTARLLHTGLLPTQHGVAVEQDARNDSVCLNFKVWPLKRGRQIGRR